jgi:hypothetical protein
MAVTGEDYPDDVFTKYRAKGVLIDTNLLLLYIIGSYNPALIQQFKRTAKYANEDYEFIYRIVDYFSVVVTTPHILTEVSNLAGQLPDIFRTAFFDTFRNKILAISEEQIRSAIACQWTDFQKLGLTDATIFAAAHNKYLVVTDDFKLSGILPKYDIDVLNLNQIRSMSWLGC